MNHVVIFSVRNKIWVKSGTTSHPKSRNDMILVEAISDIICRENITYLQTCQFAKECFLYPYRIPTRFLINCIRNENVYNTKLNNNL